MRTLLRFTLLALALLCTKSVADEPAIPQFHPVTFVEIIDCGTWSELYIVGDTGHVIAVTPQDEVDHPEIKDKIDRALAGKSGHVYEITKGCTSSAVLKS